MMKKNELTTALEEMPELQVFEASKLYNQNFNHEMSEAAYYKALERLTKEGCLAKISKGLYCRPKKTRYGGSRHDDKSRGRICFSFDVYDLILSSMRS